MRVEKIFLLTLFWTAVAGAEEKRLGWYSTLETEAALTAERQLRSLLQERGLTFISRQELFDTLHQADASSGILERAAIALEEGRKFHLGMELDKATAAFQRCYQELAQGLVQYYRPALLAEPLLQLGVVHFEAGRKEEATEFFRRAWLQSPGLKLSAGYFSPRVRDFFVKVTAELKASPPALMEPTAATRICQAAQLYGLLVVQQEPVGGDLLLRVAVFDCSQNKYLQLESAVISGEDTARLLAERLFPVCSRMAGLPSATPEDTGKTVSENAIPPPQSANAGQLDAASSEKEPDKTSVGLPDGGMEIPPETTPPPTPWYVKHWWIWPVAAAIVGSAVALPLTVFRRDVVDVHVR